MEIDEDHQVERLRRFVRHRYKKLPLVMTARDYEIIELVAAHRFIASDDIQLLVSGSDQTILRRLQKLFHHGYLDRPRIQRIQGNQPFVYALGQRGADLIATRTGRRILGNWSEKNRQVRAMYLDHGLMISRFQTALRYACDQNGTVRLECWLGDGVISDSVAVEQEDGSERIPIRPDAFFILNVLGGPQPGRVHCLVEADRGTMTVPRFVTKLRGYFHFWRSGQAEERLGVKNFLVATITTSPERAANLAKAASSVNERGLRMFLFASESEYLPAQSMRVLNAIWKTPSDPALHGLME